ncbi:MAG: oxidoreductase [Oscillospiraceae bacterium]|nr:oxidoreductase [Oscillospiraceae bacterium]
MYMIIDVAKCVGCFNCMISCKDEHVGNSWLPYTQEQQKHDQKWINPVKHERGAAPFTEMNFVTGLCFHCENAACAKAQPNSVNRRKDGVVLLDAEKAKGNKALVASCPYGKISWNEELETAQKCTMCAHLLDGGWKEPRCVQACPLRALSVVSCDEAEFEEMKKSQQLEPLTDGKNAPRVYYRNLYKLNTCFISGALAVKEGGIEKAAGDAEVRLFKDGKLVTMAATDFFGEFKIDRLPKNSGKYEVECSVDGYEPVKCAVTVTDESPNLDVIVFG